MSLYKCPRCGYLAKQRTDLRRHFTRKNICQVILADMTIEECFKTALSEDIKMPKKGALKCVENALKCVENPQNGGKNAFPPTHVRSHERNSNVQIKQLDAVECEFCHRTFKHKRYLLQHQKRYKCEAMELSQKDKIIENLKSQIEILGNTNSVTNIQNNNNYTQNNIIINAFGQENLEYIKKDFVQKLVQEGPYASIQKLIKYIHFNPNHKENHNIKIPNKRDKYGMIYDGSQWQMRNKMNMITTLATRAFDVISEHCDDLNSRHFDRFRDDFETEEVNCMKRIKDDTELIILNQQKLLGII